MGKSSKDKRDIFYRLAKEEGWRARSAFKLLQINEKYKVLENVNYVVDLCAAPGSWSQVLAKYLDPVTHTNRKIVAVDLQDMAPIPGVTQLKGDITSAETVINILELFVDQKADLIICDGAPDVTGFHDMDEYIQHQLLISALNITLHLLKTGGNFVAKIFRSGECDIIYRKIRRYFEHVTFVKPSSSRTSSVEAFVVCQNLLPFDMDIGTELHGRDKLLDLVSRFDQEISIDPDPVKNFPNRTIIPFEICPDLSGFNLDSDTSYPLELHGKEYIYCEPVQKPINPPYKYALELKKANKLCQVENQITEINFSQIIEHPEPQIALYDKSSDNG